MKKLLVLFIFLAACNKEDPKPAPSRVELLTSTDWTLITIGGETPPQGVVYSFKTSGSFSREGSLGGKTSGTWSLLNSDNILALTFTSGGSYEYPIVKLTTKELVYKDDDENDNLFHPL